MPKTNLYLRIPTSQIIADMTRYIGYLNVAQSELPVGSNKYSGKMHTFSADGYTYYMKPSNLNGNWVSSAVGRYTSFGNVRLELMHIKLDETGAIISATVVPLTQYL